MPSNDPTPDASREDLGPSFVRLHGVAGKPLADLAVREKVVSIARAHAAKMRTGILQLKADERSIEMNLSTSKIAAFAFIAEVRRQSNEWFVRMYDVGPLWPVALHHDDEADNEADESRGPSDDAGDDDGP